MGVIIGGMLISCGGNKSSEGDNGDSMSISEAVQLTVMMKEKVWRCQLWMVQAKPEPVWLLCMQ